MSKVWKPVARLSNLYEVSNCGDIRRVFVRTKLSLEDIKAIRALRKAGRTYLSIAKDFEVSKAAVMKALKPARYSLRTPYRLLKIQRSSTGYSIVRVSVNNVPTSHAMHRLIAETFLGPIPRKMDVNHKNGIKTDNRIANLEFMTRSENIRHYQKSR